MMALASGNPRQAAGIQGLLQMQQQQEDAKFKRGLLSMEMQQKQAQLDKANKLQDAISGLFGGSQTAPKQDGSALAMRKWLLATHRRRQSPRQQHPTAPSHARAAC